MKRPPVLSLPPDVITKPIRLILALTTTGLLLGGCGDGPTTGPDSAAPEAPMLSKGATTTLVKGGGKATAAPFVTYVGFDQVERDVPSINAVGNRITFGFSAKQSTNGYVEGQMQLVDHDLGIVIHSDVTFLFVPHPVHSRPVGSTGVSFLMSSSVGGVMVNGEQRPGWRFANTPGFDGGEGRTKGTGDTICFELFNAEGERVLRWSAFLTSGNVQVMN